MILDQSGKPIHSSSEVADLRRKVVGLLRNQAHVRARYDGAQTITENQLHWANADSYDPNTTASLSVRQKLRSRSRYEVLENNPYLKGTILTLCGDFTGTGPKLKVTDNRLSDAAKRVVEEKWQVQAGKMKLRQKLWRMRLAKLIDGETFCRMYIDPAMDYPVPLNLKLYETDQITSPGMMPKQSDKYNELDGIRFNDFEDVISYHILKYHPGGSPLTRLFMSAEEGEWVKAKYMIHWFRKDRGWLRGIPETAPSLPLCSILRRYTLAILRHAEVEADLTAVIETQGVPGTQIFDATSEDDPFETFPIDRGMIMNLPWGYTLKQINAVPLGVQFDEFVGAMLREITRPLLVPYNMTIGSSKDANMSSSVVDTHIYKEGQDFERLHCNEEVLDPMFDLWWRMGVLTPNYFPRIRITEELRVEGIKHQWNWDRIGLDHTDPDKVASALQKLHESKFLTDRDVQEGYYNRNVDDWREEIMQDAKFRETLPDVKAEREIAKKPDPAKPGQKPAPKAKPKSAKTKVSA